MAASNKLLLTAVTILLASVSLSTSQDISQPQGMSTVLFYLFVGESEPLYVTINKIIIMGIKVYFV